MVSYSQQRIRSACWMACLLTAIVLPALHGKQGLYSSRFNKTCRYAASNITAALFVNGTGSGEYIMPLDLDMVSRNYSKPWEACFGPGEQVDMQLMQEGRKLPCFYRINQWGRYDYWEENACDILLRTNCYCYSIGHYLGSYCEPGLGGTGKAFPVPIQDCKAAVQGVLNDGGKLVDRWTVYNTHPVDPRDSSRNTFRNGTVIQDIEHPAARGGYTSFCGYFKVWPDTHKLLGNGYYFSNLPARFQRWRQLKLDVEVATLSDISPGWLAAYRNHYAAAGWTDPAVQIQTESLTAVAYPGSWIHTYSAKPFPKPAYLMSPSKLLMADG